MREWRGGGEVEEAGKPGGIYVHDIVSMVVAFTTHAHRTNALSALPLLLLLLRLLLSAPPQFHNADEEPNCARIIRIMIDDNTKYTAADYREKLYKELTKRKKEQSRRRKESRSASKEASASGK